MHNKRNYSDYLSEGVSLSEPDWQPNWLIRDLLPTNTVTILGGVQKVGKSLLRSHLLVSSVTGRPALSSLPTIPVSRALLLAGEERGEVEAGRLRRAARGLGVEVGALPIDVLPPCGFRLDDADDFDWLVESVQERNYGLVVIDPLIRFHRRDENVAGQMAEPLTNIRQLATLTSVLVVHHIGKPREGGNPDAIGHILRGSSDIAAIYDHLIIMKGVGGKNRNLRLLQFDSRHGDRPDSMRVELGFCDDPNFFSIKRENPALAQ